MVQPKINCITKTQKTLGGPAKPIKFDVTGLTTKGRAVREKREGDMAVCRKFDAS